MTYITDTQVEQSCAILRKAINAAENSNHAGEVFVVAAANAMALVEALEGIVHFGDAVAYREDTLAVALREWIAAGNTALTLAKGGRV